MLTTKKSVFSLAALACVAGLTLSGCSGESLSESKSAPATGEVEFAAIPSEEKAKDVVEGVEADSKLNEMLPEKYRGELKWTTSVGYPPMELFGSNGTDIIGVDPALAHAISRKLGVKMSIQDNSFNAQIPGLASNRYDVIASSMTDNAERRETTTFVDYVKAGNAFLVAQGNPEKVAKPADLCGLSVAVVDSGSSAKLAEKFSAECEKNGAAAYKILPFEGDQEANLALKSGRAQATITDYPVAVTYASDPENKMEVVVIDGDEALWGLGVSKENTELAEAIQAALQSLIDDGTYGKILAAWGADAMAIDKALINGE